MSDRGKRFFDKFEELGSVAAVARFYGVSRQNVHQYLDKMPEYQKYKRPKLPPAPPCPNCESDRTAHWGHNRTKQQYKCKNCGYRWDEIANQTPLENI